eukprot:COSAG02_NODE_2795_length_8014_cov_4.340114_1_plen_177_part_00
MSWTCRSHAVELRGPAKDLHQVHSWRGSIAPPTQNTKDSARLCGKDDGAQGSNGCISCGRKEDGRKARGWQIQSSRPEKVMMPLHVDTMVPMSTVLNLANEIDFDQRPLPWRPSPTQPAPMMAPPRSSSRLHLVARSLYRSDAASYTPCPRSRCHWQAPTSPGCTTSLSTHNVSLS